MDLLLKSDFQKMLKRALTRLIKIKNIKLRRVSNNYYNRAIFNFNTRGTTNRCKFCNSVMILLGVLFGGTVRKYAFIYFSRLGDLYNFFCLLTADLKK